MHLFGRIFTILALAIFLPAASHCALDGSCEIKIPSSEPASNACLHTCITLLTSGAQIQIKKNDSLKLPIQTAMPEVGLSSNRNVIRNTQHASRLPENEKSWNFVLRTAALARAPSFLS